MVSPIRFTGSTSALRSGSAIQIGFNPRDIARVHKRFEQNMGKPLETRVKIALLKAGDLIRPAISRAAPVKTGALRRSVKTRQKGWSVQVGPTARHAHLVIRGHRIVTPGGRDTGRRSRPNPFVGRAGDPLKPRVIQLIREEAFI